VITGAGAALSLAVERETAVGCRDARSSSRAALFPRGLLDSRGCPPGVGEGSCLDKPRALAEERALGGGFMA
jgi:hypothetical protein